MRLGRTKRWAAATAALIVAAVPVASRPALADPGDLDPTFSDDGTTEAAISSEVGGEDVAVTTDGRVLVLANDNTVWRFLPDGTLDPSFDGDGVLRPSLASGLTPEFIVAQPEGGFALIGRQGTAALVGRFEADGSPAGVISFSSDLGTLRAAAVQSDGSIVVLGDAVGATSATRILVVERLSPANSLGIFRFAPFVGPNDRGEDIIVDAGDRIVVVGSAIIATPSNGQVIVARLTPDLALDASFAPGGAGGDGIDVVESTGLELQGVHVAARSDGVLGVSANRETAADQDSIVLLRWSEAGARLGAPSEMPVAGDDAVRADDIEIGTQGRFVVIAQHFNTPEDNGLAVAAFDAGGQPETTTVQIFDAGGDVQYSAAAPVGDGRIVVTGQLGNPAALDSRLLVGGLQGDGTPDDDFGGDGFEAFASGSVDAATSVVVQRDAKVVVGGTSGFGRGLVMRFDADGTPDTGFGDGELPGVAPTDFEVTGVTLGSNGTIIAVGEGEVALGSESGRPAGVVQRFLADGTPDPDFNDGDPVLVDLGDDDRDASDATTINGVIVLADGRIAVVGNLVTASTGVDGELLLAESLFAARLLEDGALDDEFAGDGVQVVTESSQAEGRALAGTADGGLVFTGGVDGIITDDPALQLVVVRLTADGERDATFAIGLDNGFGPGVLYDPIGGTSSGAGVAVAADGAITVAGTTGAGITSTGVPFETQAFVTRYSATGQRDAGFDGDGLFTSLASRDEASGTGLTIDPSGAILVSGAVAGDDESGADVVLIALSETGTLVPDFGQDGVVITDLESTERGRAVALASDRRILVAGEIIGERGARALVARYDPLTLVVPPPPDDPPPPPDDPPPPPTVFTPTVSFNPAVGRGGTVTNAILSGFPAGSTVTIAWSQGIQPADPTLQVGAGGNLTIPMLVFPGDAIGPRTMTATTVHPETGAQLVTTGTFLVDSGAAQPGDFVGRR